MARRRNRQSGFTVVELLITICIAAVLASIAIREMRDYTRRARVSEVVVASNECRNVISESYMLRDTAPDAGAWGCEKPTGTTNLVGAVQTSENGVVRMTIRNLDPLMNGRHIFLVPARSGTIPMTPADFGNNVRTWMCGSDWGPVRNALPGSCRTDMTTFASQVFE